MKTQRGFTFLEMLTVIAMVAVLLGCLAGVVPHNADHSQNEVCVAGHLFVKQPDGSVTQVISTEGGGVSCH